MTASDALSCYVYLVDFRSERDWTLKNVEAPRECPSSCLFLVPSVFSTESQQILDIQTIEYFLIKQYYDKKYILLKVKTIYV